MKKTIIDKSNWEKVTFGDVAFELKSTVKDTKEKLEYYIGLDHIDPENLHISRWGNLAEGVSFTKVFKKGQILFGRRRAYQKKAAIAPFNGVCSGDILVFEPNTNKIDSSFFPFLIQNDNFFDFAMKTSAGSLSPRTKFKDLAHLKFLLPPLKQQKELADLLWDSDLVAERYKSLIEILEIFLAVEINKLIWEKSYPCKPLSSIALDKKFMDGDWIENKDMSDSGIRLLQLADIGVNKFLNKSERYISEDTFLRLNCTEVIPGDLLMARMPDPIGRTCEVPNINSKMITAVDCCIIRINQSQHNKKYWLFFLNSQKMRFYYERVSSGTTRQRISKKNLEQLSVPFPELKAQVKIADQLSKVQDLIDQYNLQLISNKNINKHLANEIFSL